MIGYGPGHVKARQQISMVQRVRLIAAWAASVSTITRNRMPLRGFLRKTLPKFQDTLYHFGFASLVKLG
jgi:hypothetical protein